MKRLKFFIEEKLNAYSINFFFENETFYFDFHLISSHHFRLLY